MPGDIVILQAGDRVGADLRLVDSKHLEADQSILTGESTPTSKNAAVLTSETALPERSNIAYAGTLITRGWAKAVVVETGERTELGQISGALRTVHRVTTPLLDKISVFARRLSLLILVLAGGIPNDQLDPLLQPKQLTPEQRRELLAFLRSLTPDVATERPELP